MFDKNESKWVLIQVVEDDNQPDEVGKFKAWKLPFTIWEKLEAKMHPTSEKKTPVALMDYLFGPALEIDVTPGEDDPKHPERKEREISYSLCEFETDPTPVITIEGEPLFTEEEIEFIEEYASAKAKIAKAKTEKAKKPLEEYCKENLADLKKLYKKALDYIKENAFDLVEECGYHEWDATLTARVNAWLDKVGQMIDPANDSTEIQPKTSSKPNTDEDDPFQDVLDESEDEEEDLDEEDLDEEMDGDLPF